MCCANHCTGVIWPSRLRASWKPFIDGWEALIMSETLSPHILVIDDDPQIRALLKEYLAENGLRVSVASSGEEMSKILGEEAVDLVVLDLRPSREDGRPITRTLRYRTSIPAS